MKKKSVHPGFKPETSVIIIAAAVITIVLFAAAVYKNVLPLHLLAAAALAFFAVVCTAAILIIERPGRRADNTSLDEPLGIILNEAMYKQSPPMLISSRDGTILWANLHAEEYFAAEAGDLYNRTLPDLFGKSLKEIRTDRSENGVSVSIKDRTFRVRMTNIRTDGHDFALITTVDTTELDAECRRANDGELVVCYVLIDNLSEMLQYDSEQYRPASAKIDEILRDWAEEYHGILKEYERDKYIFLTDAKTLKVLIDRKFPILDTVRRISAGETNLPLTISIGVSNVPGTFEEREKAAHAALDMALQRGGDQVVIKGETSLDFIGGHTKTMQKRTNVRARVVANELINAIKASSGVIIVGHNFADFDSFGSCVGLARIAMFCGKPVNIVINMGDRNLNGCRALLSQDADFDGVFIDSNSALDILKTDTLVVVSDVNNLAITESPELIERCCRLGIIDHHRKMAEFLREPDVEYIEPSASSTSELVTEMIEQALDREDFTPIEATAMLAGIVLDTKQFSKNTGTRTFSAAMFLRDCGADTASVQTLFRESFSDYCSEAKFRANAEIYKGCCAISYVDDPDAGDRIIAAKAADNLLMVEGIRASFAVVRIADSICISARSDGSINVQLIMEKLGGGGHYDGAAAQVKEKTGEQTILALKNAIDSITEENKK